MIRSRLLILLLDPVVRHASLIRSAIDLAVKSCEINAVILSADLIRSATAEHKIGAQKC